MTSWWRALTTPPTRSINLLKSVFGQEEVKFLGHWVLASGIKPLSSHMEAVISFPWPSMRLELQCFLGLVTLSWGHSGLFAPSRQCAPGPWQVSCLGPGDGPGFCCCQGSFGSRYRDRAPSSWFSHQLNGRRLQHPRQGHATALLPLLLGSTLLLLEEVEVGGYLIQPHWQGVVGGSCQHLSLPPHTRGEGVLHPHWPKTLCHALDRLSAPGNIMLLYRYVVAKVHCLYYQYICMIVVYKLALTQYRTTHSCSLVLVKTSAPSNVHLAILGWDWHSTITFTGLGNCFGHLRIENSFPRIKCLAWIICRVWSPAKVEKPDLGIMNYRGKSRFLEDKLSNLDISPEEKLFCILDHPKQFHSSPENAMISFRSHHKINRNNKK